jgi:hypothetical protein
MADRIGPLFVIFDGPSSEESGRFVELENAAGASVGDEAAAWTEDAPRQVWKLGPFHAQSDVDALEAQNARYERERAANQAGECLLTCGFCAHAYPQGTPRANHELLAEHIAVCPKHPLKSALDVLRTVRDKLGTLLADEDLDEDTLVIASEELLPELHTLVAETLAEVEGPGAAEEEASGG